MAVDFSNVTEAAGGRATREQLSMIQTRYVEAARVASGRRVLEVACGAGRGLGLLARRAAWTVGGDYTPDLAAQARRHYGDRIPVLRLDAQHLPFVDGAFDVILCLEAIYYLPDAPGFIDECRRVLAPGGDVVISSANREWAEFTSSAHATRFYSAAELARLLDERGFEPRLMAAHAARPAGSVSRLVSLVRRAALAFGLVPATLSGRERLKRIFYGPLRVLGPEVGESDGVALPLQPIEVGRAVREYKVIYAFGKLRSATP